MSQFLQHLRYVSRPRPRRLPAAVLPLLFLASFVAADPAPTPDRFALQTVWHLPRPAGVDEWANSVQFSPDGKILAAGVGKEVRLLRADDGSLVRIIREPDTPLVGAVAFSPDGKLLATGRLKPQDKLGRLWHVEDGSVARQLEGGSRQVSQVAFSPVGSVLAVSGYGSGLDLWDWSTGRRLRSLGSDVPVGFCLAFSSEGAWIAVPRRRPNAACIWQVGDGRLVQTVGQQPGFVNTVAFSHNGRLLAVAGDAASVTAWNPSDGSHLFDLTAGLPEGRATPKIQSLVFSPDGQLLLAGGEDTRGEGTLWIWRLNDRRLLYTGAFGPPVHGVAFSPDGHHLAYNGVDGSITVAQLP